MDNSGETGDKGYPHPKPVNLRYCQEMEEEHAIKTTETLFAKYTAPVSKKRVTERGELLEYFSNKLGRDIRYVATVLKGLHDLRTLYFIKSSADAYENEGEPWAKGFYGMLKVSPLSTPVSIQGSI